MMGKTYEIFTSRQKKKKEEAENMSHRKQRKHTVMTQEATVNFNTDSIFSQGLFAGSHYLTSEYPRWFRILWILFMISTILFIVLHLYNNITEFQSRPVRISTFYETVPEGPKYPSIVICQDPQLSYTKAAEYYGYEMAEYLLKREFDENNTHAQAFANFYAGYTKSKKDIERRLKGLNLDLTNATRGPGFSQFLKDEFLTREGRFIGPSGTVYNLQSLIWGIHYVKKYGKTAEIEEIKWLTFDDRLHQTDPAVREYQRFLAWTQFLISQGLMDRHLSDYHEWLDLMTPDISETFALCQYWKGVLPKSCIPNIRKIRTIYGQCYQLDIDGRANPHNIQQFVRLQLHSNHETRGGLISRSNDSHELGYRGDFMIQIVPTGSQYGTRNVHAVTEIRSKVDIQFTDFQLETEKLPCKDEGFEYCYLNTYDQMVRSRCGCQTYIGQDRFKFTEKSRDDSDSSSSVADDNLKACNITQELFCVERVKVQERPRILSNCSNLCQQTTHDFLDVAINERFEVANKTWREEHEYPNSKTPYYEVVRLSTKKKEGLQSHAFILKHYFSSLFDRSGLPVVFVPWALIQTVKTKRRRQLISDSVWTFTDMMKHSKLLSSAVIDRINDHSVYRLFRRVWDVRNMIINLYPENQRRMKETMAYWPLPKGPDKFAPLLETNLDKKPKMEKKNTSNVTRVDVNDELDEMDDLLENLEQLSNPMNSEIDPKYFSDDEYFQCKPGWDIYSKVYIEEDGEYQNTPTSLRLYFRLQQALEAFAEEEIEQSSPFVRQTFSAVSQLKNCIENWSVNITKKKNDTKLCVQDCMTVSIAGKLKNAMRLYEFMELVRKTESSMRKFAADLGSVWDEMDKIYDYIVNLVKGRIDDWPIENLEEKREEFKVRIGTKNANRFVRQVIKDYHTALLMNETDLTDLKAAIIEERPLFAVNSWQNNLNHLRQIIHTLRGFHDSDPNEQTTTDRNSTNVLRQEEEGSTSTSTSWINKELAAIGLTNYSFIFSSDPMKIDNLYDRQFWWYAHEDFEQEGENNYVQLPAAWMKNDSSSNKSSTPTNSTTSVLSEHFPDVKELFAFKLYLLDEFVNHTNFIYKFSEKTLKYQALDKSYTWKNLVEAHIRYSTLDTKKTIKEPAYTFWSMLSDIGGTLGLYLGCCIVTAFELLFACTRFDQKIKYNPEMVEKYQNAVTRMQLTKLASFARESEAEDDLKAGSGDDRTTISSSNGPTQNNSRRGSNVTFASDPSVKHNQLNGSAYNPVTHVAVE